MVIREPIVSIDDEVRHVVWAAIGEPLTHYNASAQAFAADDGGTMVVWFADLLPNEAAPFVEQMMNEVMAVMKTTLDRIRP